MHKAPGKKKSNTRSLAQMSRGKGKNALRVHYASNQTTYPNMNSSLSCYSDALKVKPSLQQKYKLNKKCVPVKHFK